MAGDGGNWARLGKQVSKKPAIGALVQPVTSNPAGNRTHRIHRAMPRVYRLTAKKQGKVRGRADWPRGDSPARVALRVISRSSAHPGTTAAGLRGTELPNDRFDDQHQLHPPFHIMLGG